MADIAMPKAPDDLKWVVELHEDEVKVCLRYVDGDDDDDAFATQWESSNGGANLERSIVKAANRITSRIAVAAELQTKLGVEIVLK